MSNLWFDLRVEYHRMRRRLAWMRHPQQWAVERSASSETYPHLLIERTSPLKRGSDGAITAFSEEKKQNLRIAAGRMNGLVIKPGEIFSFCRLVGKTTRREGYLPALELRQGRLEPAVGGGLCQLANLLFLLAVGINAEIVERHRHSYDLFPDVGRTTPFGCGATVFYNYVDFQFRNTLAVPVMLAVQVAPPVLRAAIFAPEPLPFSVAIEESDHRFFRRDGEIFRSNRLWRIVNWHDGRPATRDLLVTNECRVLYPADELVEGDARGD